MIVHTAVGASITLATDTPETVGAVSLDSTEGTIGLVTLEGLIYQALQPRSVQVVRIGAEIRIGGISIPATELVGPVVVSRSLDAYRQEGEFTLALRSGGGHFGNPLDYFGPPTGRAPVEIWAVFLLLNGSVRKIPMLRGGKISAITRSGDPTSGYTEKYTVSDRAATIDRQTVTLVLPAGHGLDRAAIIQRLFSQLGVTAFALTGCSPLNKLSSFVDADPFRTGQNILEPMRRVLLFDANDFLVNPYLGNPQAARYRLDARDLLAGTAVNVTLNCDGITDVTLTTSQQVTTDPEAPKGRQSTTTVSRVEQLYQPVQAGYRQATTCVLTPLAAPPDSPRLIVVSEVFNTTETLEAVVVAESQEAWAWKQLAAARYSYGDSGDRHCRGDVYVGPDAHPEGGGQEQALAELSEMWRKVQVVKTTHYYDWEGYTGPGGTVSEDQPWGPFFQGAFASSRSGYKLGTITDTYEYIFVRHALKEREVGVTWEATNPINGVLTLGSGDAVSGALTFQLSTRQIVTQEANADGTLNRVTTYTLGYGATETAGGDWLYSSGTVSDQPQERFKVLTIKVEQYVPLPADAAHRLITTEIDLRKGRGDIKITTSGGAGAVPAIDRIPNTTPDPGTFLTPEEQAAASSADPSQTQTIKARVTAPALEAVNGKGVAKTDSAYAETQDELVAQGTGVIELSSAAKVDFSLSLNPDIHEADGLFLLYPPEGLAHLMQVHSIRHEINPDGPCTSAIECRIYPS